MTGRAYCGHLAQHHTKDQGDLAVAKIQEDLVAPGAVVPVPLTEHAPFELIAYVDDVFSRDELAAADVLGTTVRVRLLGTQTAIWKPKAPTAAHSILTAYAPDIPGVSPDYRVAIRDEVLHAIDAPTLQHALKEMNGARLAELPDRRLDQTRRDLLDIRFQQFRAAS